MWLYGQKHIEVSYYPSKFCGHSHSGSQDLEVIALAVPAWLVSFESNPVYAPSCQIRYWNRDIIFYINSYMDTSEKLDHTTSACHIGEVFKPRIPNYNSDVPDMADRKTRRRRRRKRRTQAIAKHYVFHRNATNVATSSFAYAYHENRH